MALKRIFGDLQFFDCDTIEIKKVSNGRWEVTITGPDRTFIVVGGRQSGGGSREWFCHCPEMYGEAWVPTTSMVKAIKLGVSC